MPIVILDLILNLLQLLEMVVWVFNYLLHLEILLKDLDSLDLDQVLVGLPVVAVGADIKIVEVKVEVTPTHLMLVG
jgi:hypothetical protein